MISLRGNILSFTGKDYRMLHNLAKLEGVSDKVMGRRIVKAIVSDAKAVIKKAKGKK